MSKESPPEKQAATWWQKRIGALIESRFVGWLANLPPISWVARSMARRLAQRELGTATSIAVGPKKHVEGVGLDATLQQIVYDVVTALGYAGAMVATYEQGDALPVRALYVDPDLATQEQILQWEQEISRYAAHPISVTNPQIARVYVYDERCKDNLSVRAFQADGAVVSDELYDLFTPIAPPASRPIVQGIQQAMGIEQVIAVPFFIETIIEGQIEREIVGNLFAAKQSKITIQDELILSAFGRQAAAAIESERRRLHIQVAQEIVFEMQYQLRDEEQVLQRIAEGIVVDLGYVGAMVATYESDDSLPVRAFHLDPHLASEETIHQWEQEVSKYTHEPISITDPSVARVFVYKSRYRNNLSVQAFKAGGIVISNDLYDLFTPIAPPVSKTVVKGIQQALGIQQVIAVPFFLETYAGAQHTREIVGNLFVATRSRKFSRGEIELLKAFSQQAAAGIRNARLYHQVEERRQVAQIFGKMAFSAAASVHALRNHIGAFQVHLNLIRSLPPEQRESMLAVSDKIIHRLDEATEILDHLHEPWRANLETLTDVNICIRRALGRLVQDKEKLQLSEGIVIHAVLKEELPSVKVTPDMLTEVFRVLIKNALEAIREKEGGGELQIESYVGANATVEVKISDTGVGLRPGDMSKIFELRWSTKAGAGMGFGLFWTREYVEGVGGEIRVESQWRKGTTFYVAIPIAIEQMMAKEED
ncbi:MAG TPA: GAF domain-containing protein [Chloroflexi bacterium]|nr:GAF domain-containing protein [Chloroflexota bacterium]